MKKLFTLALVILNTSTSWGYTRITAKSLDEIARSNFKYIASEQIQKTNSVYWQGEWPTNLYSTLVPILVGVGRPFGHDQEASAFTTASVVNQLASIYLDHPEFTQIPSLIEKATPSFQRYREGDLFNFYPPRIWKGVRVHQPAAMTLFRVWKGFTNIPQDADTSSVTFAAIYYSHAIKDEPFDIPEGTKESFATFRDVDRRGHYYNRSEHQTNTGAFLTWQFDETDPDMPRFYFAAPQKGVRIPFAKNDVDCVVNLNVLRLLALTHNEDLPGHDEACHTINRMIDKNQHASCGIYYPNTFNLAYSASLAHKAGETCIDKNRNKIVEFILKEQSADGGWYNDMNIWKDDRIQSTAFAMNALAEFGDFTDRRVVNSMKYGASFLLRNISKSKDGYYYWPGEVFFTATAIARSLVVWKSNSYTTAAATSALLKAHKLMPQYDVNYYLHLN